MELKNTYTVGVHVMFYEIQMIPEYVDACVDMLNGITNPENVKFDFTWNISEYFEEIDTTLTNADELTALFKSRLDRLSAIGCKVNIDIKDNSHPVYNIADYRRDLNYRYCTESDFVLWGETDSLWPRETLSIIEQIEEYSKQTNIFKYILFFSERKMWDPSWKPIEHNDFTDEVFQDNEEWTLNNKASSKSYMSLSEMHEINDRADELDIRILKEPKFDGSCLVIKSDLIKAGVNIPHALLCSGEDTSFADMAKLILGESYVQYVVKNILRVHNRRHPHKRVYVKDENNPRGFCGKEKGDWWKILSTMSKTNLHNLKRQEKTFLMEDVFREIERNENTSK